MKSVPVPYFLFCVVNFIWLVAFSSFSLFRGVGASMLFASGFLGLYFLFMVLCAVFALQLEEKSEFQKWFYVVAVILIGLILRIIARQIFQTAQMQDFGRAHDVYLYLTQYGPLQAGNWAELNWYQLYYSRFPGWFPHFAVTRLVYDIFGAHVRYMIFLNYILYVLSAGLLYITVKRLFSFAVAFCATAFFIFNPNLVVWANITSPDPIFIFLFLCMFYFISRFYSGESGYKFLCAAAVFAALTDFFKPIGLIFLIAFFCVEIFMQIISKEIWRKKFKQWVAFLFVFLAVYGVGHALVSAEIRRVFHVETVSSTGMYMAFAWSTDGAGNYTLNPVFEKFDRLMEEHENNQIIVMEEMSQYARELFNETRHNLRSILRQKARLTFADEGVLGWVIHSDDAEYSASTYRVLAWPLWIGFTVFIFVIMFFAAAGTVFALFEKNKAVFIFLLTTVIGYTMVLLLGVVQARYRILLYPQLSILAAVGLVGLLRACEGKKLYNFLKYHGRKIVLPVDEMKTAIKPAVTNISQIVDFGAGTLFWSEYFANELGLKVFAADISYSDLLPKNENPNISLHADILKALAYIEKTKCNAIFICDVIHHLQPEFWQEILPQIIEMFDVVIIKDIDSKHKFGNFCSAMHDRVVNNTNFENVYPNEIEKFLKEAGFTVDIAAMPKLWYPHFMLVASRVKI
ncbi:MAG: glycosyltransferase family 39 protein [Defluviitaleaceae bacterium]|nr:glycosyltransferase family 39 protein [Defluviitaleaceae bacterium]